MPSATVGGLAARSPDNSLFDARSGIAWLEVRCITAQGYNSDILQETDTAIGIENDNGRPATPPLSLTALLWSSPILPSVAATISAFETNNNIRAKFNTSVPRVSCIVHADECGRDGGMIRPPGVFLLLCREIGQRRAYQRCDRLDTRPRRL